MMKSLLLVLVVYFFASAKAQCERDTEIICYWGSWSIYREEIGMFNTENINTDICTTVVYAFAGLDLNLDLTSINTDGDINKNGYSNFTSLKDKNPCLTTMIAVGGWNEGSRKYSVLASNTERRKVFADKVLAFLAYYGFDGIDLDWEYPTTRGGISEDGENFVALLQEIKAKLTPYNLKLSIAVPIDEDLINTAYDVKQIASIVDTVNLMAYDYISSDSPVTGLSAPLSKIKESAAKWLDAGLPSKKLILGIPAYAKNFVLKDANDAGIGAPVEKIGEPGAYTKEDGLLAYYEVLQILQDWSDELTITTEDDTIYASYNDEWFTYDDETTVKTKTDYAMQSNLGGIMFWALELDDFRGTFDKQYPLLNAIKEGIDEYKIKHLKSGR